MREHGCGAKRCPQESGGLVLYGYPMLRGLSSGSDRLSASRAPHEWNGRVLTMVGLVVDARTSAGG